MTTRFFTPYLSTRSQSSATIQNASGLRAGTTGNANYEPIESGLLASRASNAANGIVPLGVSPGMELVSAYIVPQTSQAGSATNYADVQIIDLGTDGTGTAVVASKSFSAAGASVAAGAPGSFAMVASLASSIASGRSLAASYASQGNGIALVAHTIGLLYRQL